MQDHLDKGNVRIIIVAYPTRAENNRCTQPLCFQYQCISIWYTVQQNETDVFAGNKAGAVLCVCCRYYVVTCRLDNKGRSLKDSRLVVYT